MAKAPSNLQLRRTHKAWSQSPRKESEALIQGDVIDILRILQSKLQRAPHLAIIKFQALVRGCLERRDLRLGHGNRRELIRRMTAKTGLVIPCGSANLRISGGSVLSGSLLSNPTGLFASRSSLFALLFSIHGSWMGKISKIQVFDPLTNTKASIKLNQPFVPLKDVQNPKRLQLSLSSEIQFIKMPVVTSHATETKGENVEADRFVEEEKVVLVMKFTDIDSGNYSVRRMMLGFSDMNSHYSLNNSDIPIIIEEVQEQYIDLSLKLGNGRLSSSAVAEDGEVGSVSSPKDGNSVTGSIVDCLSIHDEASEQIFATVTNVRKQELLREAVSWNGQRYLVRVLNEEDVTQVSFLQISTNRIFVFLMIREYIDRNTRFKSKWKVFFRILQSHPNLACFLTRQPIVKNDENISYSQTTEFSLLAGERQCHVKLLPHSQGVTVIVIDPSKKPIFGTGFERLEEDAKLALDEEASQVTLSVALEDSIDDGENSIVPFLETAPSGPSEALVAEVKSEQSLPSIDNHSHTHYFNPSRSGTRNNSIAMSQLGLSTAMNSRRSSSVAYEAASHGPNKSLGIDTEGSAVKSEQSIPSIDNHSHTHRFNPSLSVSRNNSVALSQLELQSALSSAGGSEYLPEGVLAMDGIFYRKPMNIKLPGSRKSSLASEKYFPEATFTSIERDYFTSSVGAISSSENIPFEEFIDVKELRTGAQFDEEDSNTGEVEQNFFLQSDQKTVLQEEELVVAAVEYLAKELTEVYVSETLNKVLSALITKQYVQHILQIAVEEETLTRIEVYTVLDRVIKDIDAKERHELERKQMFLEAMREATIASDCADEVLDTIAEVIVASALVVQLANNHALIRRSVIASLSEDYVFSLFDHETSEVALLLQSLDKTTSVVAEKEINFLFALIEDEMIEEARQEEREQHFMRREEELSKLAARIRRQEEMRARGYFPAKLRSKVSSHVPQEILQSREATAIFDANTVNDHLTSLYENSLYVPTTHQPTSVPFSQQTVKRAQPYSSTAQIRPSTSEGIKHKIHQAQRAEALSRGASSVTAEKQSNISKNLSQTLPRNAFASADSLKQALHRQTKNASFDELDSTSGGFSKGQERSGFAATNSSNSTRVWVPSPVRKKFEQTRNLLLEGELELMQVASRAELNDDNRNPLTVSLPKRPSSGYHPTGHENDGDALLYSKSFKEVRSLGYTPTVRVDVVREKRPATSGGTRRICNTDYKKRLLVNPDKQTKIVRYSKSAGVERGSVDVISRGSPTKNVREEDEVDEDILDEDDTSDAEEGPEEVENELEEFFAAMEREGEMETIAKLRMRHRPWAFREHWQTLLSDFLSHHAKIFAHSYQSNDRHDAHNPKDLILANAEESSYFLPNEVERLSSAEKRINNATLAFWLLRKQIRILRRALSVTFAQPIAHVSKSTAGHLHYMFHDGSLNGESTIPKKFDRWKALKQERKNELKQQRFALRDARDNTLDQLKSSYLVNASGLPSSASSAFGQIPVNHNQSVLSQENDHRHYYHSLPNSYSNNAILQSTTAVKQGNAFTGTVAHGSSSSHAGGAMYSDEVNELTLLTVEEMIVALAETHGSVGEVISKLTDQTHAFLAEIQLVCSVLNVRDLLCSYEGGKELFNVLCGLPSAARKSDKPNTRKTIVDQLHCDDEKMWLDASAILKHGRQHNNEAEKQSDVDKSVTMESKRPTANTSHALLGVVHDMKTKVASAADNEELLTGPGSLSNTNSDRGKKNPARLSSGVILSLDRIRSFDDQDQTGRTSPGLLLDDSKSAHHHIATGLMVLPNIPLPHTTSNNLSLSSPLVAARGNVVKVPIRRQTSTDAIQFDMSPSKSRPASRTNSYLNTGTSNDAMKVERTSSSQLGSFNVTVARATEVRGKVDPHDIAAIRDKFIQDFHDPVTSPIPTNRKTHSIADGLQVGFNESVDLGDEERANGFVEFNMLNSVASAKVPAMSSTVLLKKQKSYRMDNLLADAIGRHTKTAEGSTHIKEPNIIATAPAMDNFVVMCRRDAIKASREEILGRSDYLHLRGPIERKKQRILSNSNNSFM